MKRYRQNMKSCERKNKPTDQAMGQTQESQEDVLLKYQTERGEYLEEILYW